jgi:hypothetical protein
MFEQRHFLRFHNADNSGRTCIYFGKLFKKGCLTSTVDNVLLKNLEGKRQYKVVLRKLLRRNLVKRVDKFIGMNGHHFQHLL